MTVIEDIEAVDGEIEEVGVALVEQAADPSHYTVVGMGMLAALSDEEYERRKAIMKKGLERVEDIQKTLMTKGEDYGIVPGIKRPFLHLPGAEKLANFYGLAVRQEVKRIVGDGVTSPPLDYHVESYVHLGSTAGPIVADGKGEANSWEEKYRWRFAKAKCPVCGREGLIKGKEESRLKGKWWCPGREGGCNRTFEPNDESIATPGKVENTDPWSMAETLIQMAAKRSFVAAIRRATGTSGLFTQDDDSPSVREQAGDTPPPDDNPTIESVSDGPAVGRGAKTEKPSMDQIAALATLSRDKDLGPAKVMAVIQRVVGIPLTKEQADSIDDEDRAKSSKALVAIIKANLTADELGRVLVAIDTGVVPELRSIEIIDRVLADEPQERDTAKQVDGVHYDSSDQ